MAEGGQGLNSGVGVAVARVMIQGHDFYHLRRLKSRAHCLDVAFMKHGYSKQSLIPCLDDGKEGFFCITGLNPFPYHKLILFLLFLILI